MDKNTKRLHTLMKKHKLSCKQVGEILDRATMTIRIWRTGSRIIPSHSLKLLEHELVARGHE
jgi:hypothetical protein